jgi:hypothetical protein
MKTLIAAVVEARRLGATTGVRHTAFEYPALAPSEERYLAAAHDCPAQLDGLRPVADSGAARWDAFCARSYRSRHNAD